MESLANSLTPGYEASSKRARARDCVCSWSIPVSTGSSWQVPYPSVGHVAADGGAFRWVAVFWD
ncbi:hypothetical protein AGR9A_Lc40494 [Agrobacterium salinitolerans str. Hayward 0363]|nr:hypothetical protein AGR9A_Lc40494 [Agrobacterium salinitolerans str. Hayward 0363]